MTQSKTFSERPRLAVVVSHPIQYYAPYYRAIAAEGSVQIKAFFCSRIAVDKMLDPGMGVEISWKTDLLGGYDHEFLPEASSIKTTAFKEIDNPSIVARLEAYKPDVVLVHGYAQKTLLRTIQWCRRNRVPIMNISDRSLFGLTTPARKLARRVVLPFILRQYSAFLVISDAVHKFYATFGANEEQIFRVPSMLDEGFWTFRKRREKERALVRASLGLTNEFVVLYVGKLMPRKRPQDLLDALVALRSRPNSKRPICVLFAGDGEMREVLEAKTAAKNLPAKFLGFVNIDELPKYYCAADALAHPAENESFGMIALEAAVLGLPLILTDRVGAVGPTSIARPGENAIVHASGDINALADAMELLANSKDIAAQMSAASLRLSEDHTGTVSVTNTLAAIDLCLSKQAGVGLNPSMGAA